MLSVDNYILHFAAIWENSSSTFPEFHREYSIAEQHKREGRFEEFQKTLKELQNKKNIRKFKNDPGTSFFPMFKSFLETVFDYEKEQLEIILSESFRNVSIDFFYKAREFGPELQPQNIYQGLRNVWIMNGIQLMMGLPVEITPSVFAYSMIYPYSDNLLDDPAITPAEKQAFSERFNQRLHGFDVEPQGHIEKQLFRLVEMFEQQFNRKEYPDVYKSLYAIQQGQTKSISLLKQKALPDDQILSICFEKGGASVLADGFLVAGNLNREQQQALFGYGVYLQLLDDIQDVKEDSGANTTTLFTCLPGNPLEQVVNKTIHFGRTALDEMKCFNMPKVDTFLELMNRSIEMMILESVGLNETWYSQHYLDQMNHFSPLRFSFVRQKKSESKSQRLALFQKYFSQTGVRAVKIV